MIKSQKITFVTVNCVNPEDGIKALNYSRRSIAWKHAPAIIFTHEDITIENIRVIKIEKLNSVDQYNDFILRLGDYINSEFVILVQDDGFVLNPDQFCPAFLNYDFIGAPWPDEESWMDMQKLKPPATSRVNRVGNGGFSLRSRKFLELSSKFTSCEGFGEDTFLCRVKYDYMIGNGIRFAPIDLALKFSYENPIREMGCTWRDRVSLDPAKHFGFHGKNFINSQQLIDFKNK